MSSGNVTIFSGQLYPTFLDNLIFLFFKAFIGRPKDAVVDLVSIILKSGLVGILISTVKH